MKRYTIYCTEEQTLKAERLGAPIKKTWKSGGHSDLDKYIYKKPTAEQMCGWLREKGLNAYADCTSEDSYYGSVYDMECEDLKQINGFSNYEDAIRAAIGAALDYLENEGGEE